MSRYNIEEIEFMENEGWSLRKIAKEHYRVSVQALCSFLRDYKRIEKRTVAYVKKEYI